MARKTTIPLDTLDARRRRTTKSEYIQAQVRQYTVIEIANFSGFQPDRRAEQDPVVDDEADHRAEGRHGHHPGEPRHWSVPPAHPSASCSMVSPSDQIVKLSVLES